MDFNIVDVFQFIVVIIITGYQNFPSFASESLSLLASESFGRTPVVQLSLLPCMTNVISTFYTFPALDLESVFSKEA